MSNNLRKTIGAILSGGAPAGPKRAVPVVKPEEERAELLEAKLVRHYRAALKTSLEAGDFGLHAATAEKLIALGDASGHHAKIAFLSQRGESAERLRGLAAVAYSLQPSNRSALHLASLGVDADPETDPRSQVETAVLQLKEARHADAPQLEMRLATKRSGEAAGLALFAAALDDPDAGDAARARIFPFGARHFPKEARERAFALLSTLQSTDEAMLRALGAFFHSNRSFAELEEVISKLEPVSPFDALWFRNLEQSLKDSTMQVWEESERFVAEAATNGNPAAVRLLPSFRFRCLSEALKCSVAPETLLIQAKRFFLSRPHLVDLNLAIGVIRKLKSAPEPLRDFVFFVRERLWNSDLPRDWLGNVELLTGKLLDALSEAGMAEEFLRGLDLAAVRREQVWLTAYEFAPVRSVGLANARILQDHRALQTHLVQSSGCDLFDARVSERSRQVILHRVESSIRDGLPFSALRLGDGEAYGFPSISDEYARQHLADNQVRELYWWGRPIADSLREQVRSHFLDAVRSATLLGIPNSFRLLRDLEVSGAGLCEARTGRGLVTVLRGLQEEIAAGRIDPARVLFTDERFHQTVFSSVEDLGRCLALARRVVIVSCFPDQEILKRLPDPKKSVTVQVPPHTLTASISDFKDKTVTLPDVLTSLLERVAVESSPGTLVLVAAGFAGKAFLKAAQDRGGVALDIGAALDYWLGLKTRSFVDVV